MEIRQTSATIPGGVYSDLRDGNILRGDFYYRFNDADWRWVAREDWQYSTSFNVERAFLAEEAIILDVQGKVKQI